MTTVTSTEDRKPMEAVSIDEWVKQLRAIPEKQFTIPSVLEFAQRKAIQPETLAPYIFYANSHYTRNLIYKCELFEILAICWNVGQVSRIHNHRGQNCWMVTPEAASWSPRTPTSWTQRTPPWCVPKSPCIRCKICRNTISPPPACTFILIHTILAKCIPWIKARMPMCRCIIPANTASFRRTRN
jgi:hypothetical protein